MYQKQHNPKSLEAYSSKIMAGTLFRLFLIFIGLSHLLCLKAVPITRSESLVQVPEVDDDAGNKQEVINMKRKEEEASVRKRMDMELHDYSPYGANSRHTPRGP